MGLSSLCHTANSHWLFYVWLYEWIRKLWYIYTMEYYSATKRNAFQSVLMRCVILEPIIQSEVSQKEKDKYCILTPIYGIYKDGMGNPLCRAPEETQT